jgi:hypothetical protein
MLWVAELIADIRQRFALRDVQASEGVTKRLDWHVPQLGFFEDATPDAGPEIVRVDFRKQARRQLLPDASAFLRWSN